MRLEERLEASIEYHRALLADLCSMLDFQNVPESFADLYEADEDYESKIGPDENGVLLAAIVSLIGTINALKRIQSEARDDQPTLFDTEARSAKVSDVHGRLNNFIMGWTR